MKILKRINRYFEKFENIHNGQRCFIIANGPSLIDTNLDLIKHEISIAMNRISLIYDKFPEWRPTYYLFSSTNVKNEIWGRAWTDSVRRSIACKRTISFIAKMFKYIIDPDDSFPHVHWFESMSECKPSSDGQISDRCFSTDIVERIDKSGTTMNLALQLAYYMGFSEIVFVGADLGWTKDTGSINDPNHFDFSYRANISRPEKVNHQIRNIHSLALKRFRERNKKVLFYNASVKTVLDIYPVIDFERYVIDNEIIYRNEDSRIAKDFWKGTFPQYYENPT